MKENMSLKGWDAECGVGGGGHSGEESAFTTCQPFTWSEYGLYGKENHNLE